MGPSLSRSQLRRLYDRTGRRQDTLAFYSGPAFDALCTRPEWEAVQSVVELGCGTGRLAERLLRDHLPDDAQYLGLDLSGRMVTIARDRLSSFGPRAAVRRTDGRLSFEQNAGSQDCVLATYVLDLLSPSDIRDVLAEAHRVLGSSGQLVLAGLTWGTTPVTRLVSAIWDGLYSLRPTWVGGCRPVDVRRFLADARWQIRHHEVVRAWGIPSAVLIAEPR